MKKRITIFDKGIKKILIVMVILTAATSCSSAQNKKIGITDKEVENYFINWWDGFCRGGNSAKDMCKISFDSPVRIGTLTQHTFQMGGTYQCYPVKVNFTTAYSNEGISINNIMHFTNAVYYFYKDSYGDLHMGKENEKTSEEHLNKYPIGQVQNYPKPNFSALEKWYEIVKYDYPNGTGQQMTIYFKPIGKERPWSFEIEYRDKNGNLIGYPYSMLSSAPLIETQVGETGIFKVYTPLPTEMAKIASAKFVIPK